MERTPFFKTEKLWLLVASWKNSNYTLKAEDCTGSPDIDMSQMPKLKLSEFDLLSDSIQKQINRNSSAMYIFNVLLFNFIRYFY